MVVDLGPFERWYARQSQAGCASDRVTFAQSLGVTADPWQVRVLRSASRRMLLNCARQSGKSTVSAILALHQVVFEPNSLVLLVSPTLRQSSELFRKVNDFRKRMPTPPDLVEDNKLSLELANGSRIVSLPGSESTIRGFSAPKIVIEDEAGDVPDELYTALRPMVAVSRGQMILVGTPKGRRGHFFENWQRPGEWQRESITVHENPRLAAEEIEEMRRDLGPLFAQECECQFINAATGRVYDGFDEERNVIDEAPPLTHIILSLDFGIIDQNALTALGWRDNDPCVYVLESYRLTGDVRDMADEVRRMEQKYKPERVIGDLSGMGKAFETELRARQRIPVVPAEKHNKVGYIALMNADLRKNLVRVVRRTCGQLIEEWQILPWAENRQKELDGVNNHCADASLYGWRAAYAYREVPSLVAPKPGTPEHVAAQEQRLLDARTRAIRAAEKAAQMERRAYGEDMDAEWMQGLNDFKRRWVG